MHYNSSSICSGICFWNLYGSPLSPALYCSISLARTLCRSIYGNFGIKVILRLGRFFIGFVDAKTERIIVQWGPNEFAEGYGCVYVQFSVK